LAILATALVLSASRMGAFVAALGIACAFLIAFLRSPERRGGVVLGLVAIVAVAVGVLITAGGQLSDRVGSLETNLDERLLLYRQVLEMITARPWTGYGGGSFAAAFPLFHELPLSADVTWDSAHNLYFELFTDLGFVAIFPLLAVLVLTLRAGRALADRKVHWVAPATAICMTVIAAVHSLVDFSLQIEANVMFYVAILAAGAAQAELVKRRTATAVEGNGSRTSATQADVAFSPAAANSG
jgi:O-antigen ligase